MPAPSQGSADTALVKARENLSTLRALIDRSASQIRMALPKHMDVQRLTRIALTSLQRTPRLLECDPITVIGALMQCAQLGL